MTAWLFTTPYDDDDDLPPTLGVREPRVPQPPTLTGGAEAPLAFTADREPEAAAEGACVT